jgi:pimeloyl-ACP methyl ester carboxylesterase
MKNVYLIPGFLASNLGLLPDGPLIWFAPNLVTVLGLGYLRLAPNGVDPQPPDGQPMGVALPPQDPWPEIQSQLQAQLDVATWSVAVGPYDWRLDLNAAATSLAGNIRRHSTLAEPATIVGHSAGGLVAVLAWANLNATGDAGLVRRIISICTPFQGSYEPIQWLVGISPSVQQCIALGNSLIPGSSSVAYWGLNYLNALALTWPSFYQLFPSLVGSEAANDPNRPLLYQVANYPIPTTPSQAWLDYVRNTFQPLIASPATFPPDYVMTCVVAGACVTPDGLQSKSIPLTLRSMGSTWDGDGIVTIGSQTRDPSAVVRVAGSHDSVPMAITQSGKLRDLILDPRGPLDPPPPEVRVAQPIAFNVTAPPESDYVSTLQCIGGG